FRYAFSNAKRNNDGDDHRDAQDSGCDCRVALDSCVKLVKVRCNVKRSNPRLVKNNRMKKNECSMLELMGFFIMFFRQGKFGCFWGVFPVRKKLSAFGIHAGRKNSAPQLQ